MYELIRFLADAFIKAIGLLVLYLICLSIYFSH